MSQTVSFPIGGMTCAACAARIEKVLNRQKGVQATVNFASERAQVQMDGPEASLETVVAAVRKAGFTVEERSLDLSLTGMSCAACAARIEKILNKLPMTQASVNFATERAHVTYVPGIVEPEMVIARIENAGFGAKRLDNGVLEDPDAGRQALWRTERNRFFLTAVLSLPFLCRWRAWCWGAWP